LSNSEATVLVFSHRDRSKMLSISDQREEYVGIGVGMGKKYRNTLDQFDGR
jgi:hypothetical protein